MHARSLPSPARFALAAALLATASSAQTQLLRLDGPAAGAEYGTSLAVLGDLDGDGADDFAVGAPKEDARRGAVRVHSGRTGALLATLSGSSPDDFFGQDVSAMDDVDGDGLSELLIGAPEREVFDGDCVGPGGGFGTAFGPGYVQVVSGASGAVLYTLPSPGGAGDVFGFKVTGGGDIDADGDADFLVPTGYSGQVRLYDGATGALVRVDDVGPFLTTYDATILGPVDANPGVEYAVGWIDASGCFSGGVRAFRGKSGSPFWTDFVCQPGDEYGFFVESIGDVDGDGIRDVVGCGLDTAGFGCTGFGYARVLSGLDGSLLYTSTGFKYGGRGRSAVNLGDLNGDGSDDLALGEPGLFSNTGQDLRVQNGLPGTPFFSLPPDDPGDGFGVALASGDLNGDGLRDLVVGARWDDDGGTDAGSVEVHTVWTGVTNYCEAQTNSQGCTPTLFATGMPSLTYNSFRVKASGVLNGKPGLLFWGLAPKQTPFGGGGGGGSLCVAAPVVRTKVQNSGGNPPPDDCSGQFSFHFNKPYMNQQGLTPGTHVYCQYWSRDPASPSTTHLTDALAFTVDP